MKSKGVIFMNGEWRTMKKHGLKATWLALIALGTIALTSGAAQALEEWSQFPGNYDGVSIAMRVHYFPYDCNVNWKFTNNNSYPVKIEVFNKVYLTNYGEKFIARGDQTFVELRPGESRSMLGLGDQLSYEDVDFGGVLNSRSKGKNGNKMATFVVKGLKGWEYRVTRLTR
ncbi:MAG: hypothetical protein LBD04_05675 [Synergistaceae bacterium]|jgi:hypothetical protein|nr:hypothetical protein [Synergistaceae bacterium]